MGDVLPCTKGRQHKTIQNNISGGSERTKTSTTEINTVPKNSVTNKENDESAGSTRRHLTQHPLTRSTRSSLVLYVIQKLVITIKYNLLCIDRKLTR